MGTSFCEILIPQGTHIHKKHPLGHMGLIYQSPINLFSFSSSLYRVEMISVQVHMHLMISLAMRQKSRETRAHEHSHLISFGQSEKGVMKVKTFS